MEQIKERLENIKADAGFYVDNNEIQITINDFKGFDDDYNEIKRELKDCEAVEKVLKWLEENADNAYGDYYRYYHFDKIILCVGYASFDI